MDKNDYIRVNAHKRHIESIIPMDSFLSDDLDNILKASKVKNRTKTHIKTETIHNELTEVYPWSYNEENMSILVLMAHNQTSGKNEIVTAYPYFKENYECSTDIKIERVTVAENQAEALVDASLDGNNFTFFASDYFSHKELYKKGNVLPIMLGALGMEVEGIPSSVDSHSEDLVFCKSVKGFPDEYHFQSPTLWEEDQSLLGTDFINTKILLISTADERYAIHLYFRKDSVPDYRMGDTLKGKFLLTGRINDYAIKAREEQKKEEEWPLLGEMAERIADSLDKLELEKMENLNDILPLFSDIKIQDGLVLDSCKVGDRYAAHYVPYCRDINAEPIIDMVSYDDAENLLPVLTGFEVPFTERGIMQAWLIDNLTIFMPRFWHANYGSKHYVFREEDMFDICHLRNVDHYTHVALKAINIKQVVPKVIIGRNSALFTYSYWTPWGGFVKIGQAVERTGESVTFGEADHTTLVYYDCGIRF